MGLPGAALSISISEWAAAATYLAIGWTRRAQLGLGQSGSTGDSSSTADSQNALQSYKAGKSSNSSNGNGSESSSSDFFAAPMLSREASASLSSLASYDAMSSGFFTSSIGSMDGSLEGRDLPASGPTSLGERVLSSLASYVPFLQVSQKLRFLVLNMASLLHCRPPLKATSCVLHSMLR